MEKEKIPIAGDHKAFELKSEIIKYLKKLNFEPIDLGTYSTERVDYPLYSMAVAEKVSKGQYQRGIVICWSGIGVSIVANKYPRVRAGLVADEKSAELTKKHNNTNILALGSGKIEKENAKKIVKTWLSTQYEGGRHQRRLNQIDKLERGLMHELDDAEMKEIKISASLMCANQLNLLDDINKLVTAGIDMFHVDIIDGLFAPNICMNTEQVFDLRSHTSLPIEVHLMVKNPKRYIDELAEAGADIITIHVESEGDMKKHLKQIKSKGMEPSLAIEVDTPLKKITPYLEYARYIMFMGVKTGFKSQPFVPGMIKKMEEFNKHISNKKIDIKIIVDGSVGPRTITHFYRAGATIFIGGTSGLFKQGTFEDNIRQMKSYCY